MNIIIKIKNKFYNFKTNIQIFIKFSTFGILFAENKISQNFLNQISLQKNYYII